MPRSLTRTSRASNWVRCWRLARGGCWSWMNVWEPEQLSPFTEGSKRCARLVTTRVPGLLAGRGTAVRVDQMSPEQARALLTSGLPQLDPAVADGLLAVTGRWPLLLRPPPRH